MTARTERYPAALFSRELFSREQNAFAPAPPGRIFPVPAEGVVRAAADVRGVAALPPSRGVAHVEPPRPHDAGAVLPPRVVRAVAAVPGALPLPRPPAQEPERTAIGRRDGAAGTGGEVADPVPKKRLRQTALPVVAAGVAAFVVATGYLAVSGRRSTSDFGRWGAHAIAAPVTVTGRGAGDPFGPATTVPAGVPTRLRVKAIGLDTSLEKLRLGAGGALIPPGAYGATGWYSGGTAPGDVGPAVIAGHVDSKSGPAVFYRLRELMVGDRIEVVRGGQVVRFTVTRTAWYPKAKFPTGDVYGPTPDRQLRLITCGGVFDHRLRSYTDNLVVYAVAG